MKDFDNATHEARGYFHALGWEEDRQDEGSYFCHPYVDVWVAIQESDTPQRTLPRFQCWIGDDAFEVLSLYAVDRFLAMAIPYATAQRLKRKR